MIGRKMKNILANLLSVFFMLIVVSCASTKNEHGDMLKTPDLAIPHLTERLNLTLQQERDIHPIIEGNHAMLKSLRSRYDEGKITSRKALNRQLKSIKENTTLRLSKVLTDEQMDEYQKMWDELYQKRAEHKKRVKAEAEEAHDDH
ncbi:hypothetical protein MNBD_NITROSPINAE01-1769 [hydrothermal vent metagenome]|uniref:Lipoprotein n=1 Tax=hydrothermal vent metagenome TaxID=652676 RepID=A0A3B1BXZ5_9ZZZZ